MLKKKSAENCPISGLYSYSDQKERKGNNIHKSTTSFQAVEQSQELPQEFTSTQADGKVQIKNVDTMKKNGQESSSVKQLDLYKKQASNPLNNQVCQEVILLSPTTVVNGSLELPQKALKQTINHTKTSILRQNRRQSEKNSNIQCSSNKYTSPAQQSERIKLKDYLYKIQVTTKQTDLKRPSLRLILSEEKTHNASQTHCTSPVNSKKKLLTKPSLKLDLVQAEKYGVTNSKMLEVIKTDMLGDIAKTIEHLKILQEAFQGADMLSEPSNSELLAYYNARRVLKEKVSPVLSAMKKQFVGENAHPENIQDKQQSPIRKFRFEEI